ncbi:MAG: hypothetical protein IT430_08060 [Phycisphaerales bacterium]|nr:hypothetical protein [Phycisphaerales bacterium]
MKWSLTIILGLLLAQLWLPGAVDARPTDMSADCQMACCAPQAPSCCDEPATPPPTEADCACQAHSGRRAPVSPAPQPRDTRVDLQMPAASATAILPQPALSLATRTPRQRVISPPSHNTVQALKGVWRT